ncbi:Peroxiredoxin [Bryocella elongata]|uniref:thioredoxin-dependent peroxiredoxin n=1 Tax=Bryocella elongata TaxID=863522 RepID=A0A1H5ZJ07_9BACT|nr:peroxiredoxin-like family protein [Bryocella elongata]SEG35755.1 Peroxiredoxin [Bryocella elongata]
MQSSQPASTLQERLDEITANTRGLVQPERLAITDQAVADLFASGIEDRVLAPGAAAPSFALKDTRERLVRSDDLLALGPLVIKFFRGRWCPYCMTELVAWEQLYPALRARNALLVGISPQVPRQNAFTLDRHSLTFPLLSDPGAAVATAYGVAYTVPVEMQRHYRSILVNVPFLNGDESWRLPAPATVIISRSGEVVFSESHADHRVRPDPQLVMEALDCAL